MSLSRKNSAHSQSRNSVFEEISEYSQIITDLSRGRLKSDFALEERKSKLCHSLNTILFDDQNDELDYFILFMDSLNASSYVKFLLDLKNYEQIITGSSSQCGQCPIDHNQIVAQEALPIFAKYITREAEYSIQAPSDMIDDVIHRICPEGKGAEIDSECFRDCREYVLHILQTEFYDKYLVSEHHCKYILNVLENRLLQLTDVLYDDIAVVYFLEYLEQENISDLLKFWIQAENFNRNVLSFKEIGQTCFNEALFNQWQSDAIIIYDNFISMQAKNKLGFDQLTRQSVESNICTQNSESEEDLSSFITSYANCFYVPMLIVLNILDKVYFTRFFTSSIYVKYITEIKKSSNKFTKTADDEQKPKREDCSDKNGKMSDPFWARPQSDRILQFGKVDSSGRYIGYNGLVNVRSDPTARVFNDITNEYDDDWNLDADLENEKKQVGVLEKTKMRFEKFIQRMPLNGMTSSYTKASSEDLEIAEQMADLLVKEVVGNNQYI